MNDCSEVKKNKWLLEGAAGWGEGGLRGQNHTASLRLIPPPQTPTSIPSPSLLPLRPPLFPYRRQKTRSKKKEQFGAERNIFGAERTLPQHIPFCPKLFPSPVCTQEDTNRKEPRRILKRRIYRYWCFLFFRFSCFSFRFSIFCFISYLFCARFDARNCAAHFFDFSKYDFFNFPRFWYLVLFVFIEFIFYLVPHLVPKAVTRKRTSKQASEQRSKQQGLVGRCFKVLACLPYLAPKPWSAKPERKQASKQTSKQERKKS